MGKKLFWTLFFNLLTLAQVAHRNAFFVDITDQIPPEILKGGRIIYATSTEKEIIFLAQISETGVYYRQERGGRFVPLISDNDPRLKGKFSYRFYPEDPIISFPEYQHTPYGLLFFTVFKEERGGLLGSVYFIKSGSNSVEPIAVARETIKVSDKFGIYDLKITSAHGPFISRDGKNKFVFLLANREPNNWSWEGIYKKSEEGKYSLLLRSSYPSNFTIKHKFGVREDEKGRLWFVKIRASSNAPTNYYLSVFDPKTDENFDVYREGDPIFGNSVREIIYFFDNQNQDTYALTLSYNQSSQKWEFNVFKLDFQAFPGQVFKPLFTIPNVLEDGTQIAINYPTAVSKELILFSSWTDEQRRERVFSLWNGEKMFTLLKEGDLLPNNQRIEKLYYRTYDDPECQPPYCFPAATVVGTLNENEGTIFTFRSDRSIQYWLKFFVPYIKEIPASVKVGEEVIIKGKGLYPERSSVEVVMRDENGKELIINPIKISPTEIRFLAPSIDETRTFKIRAKINHPTGTVFSNSLPLRIEVAVPLPRINSIVNAASFQPEISPGGLATIFGKNLANREVKAENLPLPFKLGGVEVTFDGHKAPLYYVSPTQINLQIPLELGAPADVRLEVIRDGIKSETKMVRIEQVSPGIFQYNGLPIITKADYSLVTPENPLSPGETAILWLTGLGQTNPPAKTGEPILKLAEIVNPIYLKVGEKETKIIFAGLSPNLVGVYQINFIVPEGISSNEVVFIVSDKKLSFKIPFLLKN